MQIFSQNKQSFGFEFALLLKVTLPSRRIQFIVFGWKYLGEIDSSIKFLNPEKLTLEKDETLPTSPIPTKVIMSWIEEAIY